MANIAGTIVMKLLTVAVGIPVGIATKKALEQTWSAARSTDTPRKPSESGVRWADAIGWAALSGAGLMLANLITRRGAEELWRTIVGTEPPAKVDKSKSGQQAGAKAVDAQA
jgi:hypothetical protein